MHRFISRCASALTVTAVAFTLTTTGSSATAALLPDPDTGGNSLESIVATTQSASPTNHTTQSSDADAASRQRNVNLPLSILSVGDGLEHPGASTCADDWDRCGVPANGDQGSSQMNTASNDAWSTNDSDTVQQVVQSATQHVRQDTAAEGAGLDGDGDEESTDTITGDASIDQQANPSNTTDQQSTADASSKQVNVNAPIAILAVDSNNGDVDQTNTATNTADSANTNATDQTVTQTADQTVDQMTTDAVDVVTTPVSDLVGGLLG
ncbi:MAG: hypothetical protein R2743_12425 [Ilumatobacteraceae bacterium]